MVIPPRPTGPIKFFSVWKTLWIEYRSGGYDEAYKVFSINEPSFKGFKGMDRLLYWAARSASKSGMETEARSLYERLCPGFKGRYYCQLAEDRIGAIGGPEGAFEEPSSPLQISADAGKGALFSEDSYLAAEELILSGLGKDASEELSFLVEAYADDRDILKEIAFMFKDAGDYKRALASYYRYIALSDRRGDSPATDRAV